MVTTVLNKINKVIEITPSLNNIFLNPNLIPSILVPNKLRSIYSSAQNGLNNLASNLINKRNNFDNIKHN
jgi:hypothetical protein